ncbi:MAG: ATP-binding protein [Bacteroidota bacterium]
MKFALSSVNFKVRSAILFTALVAVLLLVSYTVIYYSYKTFKEDEFFLRLEQKALTTYRFLTEVKEIDYNLLKVIDKNTINELYNEKVLIFDASHKLIYSSIDDQAISYSKELLNRIEEENAIRYNEGYLQVVGLMVKHQGKQGIVIASADDTYGENKLENLLYTLLISYIVALMLTALLSYVYVKQSFAPIDVLNQQITRIRQNRLNERVPVNKSKDELNQLASNFNNMLDRIESAFNVQRSFIQHASHELRTPLANLIASCESALNKALSVAEYRTLIESLNEEHRNLVELTNALLLLSKYESETDALNLPQIRADELLFEVMDEVQKLYPGHMIQFSFGGMPQNETALLVRANEVLLKTALGNLLRNACKYAVHKEVSIILKATEDAVDFCFINDGPVINDDETEYMMQPFFRARNAEKVKGYGLGLSIAKRIVDLHKGTLTYSNAGGNNQFFVLLIK